MAKIGLLDPMYAKITIGTNDSGAETETYGAATVFAKAVTATTSINTAKTKFYADDGVAEMVNEFLSGQITFTSDDLEDSVKADIIGATVAPEGGEVTYKDTDQGSYVRFGFLVRRQKNKAVGFKAVVFTKVLFDIPADDYETKGESIVFKGTQLTGEIMRNVDHVWKLESGWKDDEATALAELKKLLKPETT